MDGPVLEKTRNSFFVRGIASLIGHYTDEVINVVVKSAYCKSCEFWKDKEDTTKYEEWSKSHTNCQINHEDSVAKMEVNVIIEMFAHSENLLDVNMRSISAIETAKYLQRYR